MDSEGVCCDIYRIRCATKIFTNSVNKFGFNLDFFYYIKLALSKKGWILFSSTI